MTSFVTLLLPLMVFQTAPPARSAASDTLRLEVGSPEVDGRVFPVHKARNRVYIGDATEPSVTWTNELVLGDSAGVPVMRWITLGEPGPGSQAPAWDLRQTYNARTLAPMAYSRTATNGAYSHLRFDGMRVHGVKRAPGEAATEERVDQTLDRLGFMASASDLVPMAVGLRAGTVMTAPVWGPNMAAAEGRIFTVLQEEKVMVEGSEVTAWKVEERIEATRALAAIWWLTEESPYMVLAEVMLPNGGVQRITGVDLGRGGS
jgi:hypothetical protein